MYHSLDFLDLLQLDLKLHSIFPTFMETKSLMTIQNRGKEKELDKNKSWYVPWQPPFCFFTLYFSESSDDPIPYEAKATSKVQVVNFCLSLSFLGNQTEIRVPGKSWQKFFLLTKQFSLMTYWVSDPSCGTISKYDLFCCWEIKWRERKRKKNRAGILETPIWKARMYLQVCDFLETEGQENLDFLGNQTEKRKVKKTAEKKDNKNGDLLQTRWGWRMVSADLKW